MCVKYHSPSDSQRKHFADSNKTFLFYLFLSYICLLLEIASAIFGLDMFLLLSTGNCFELRKTKLDKFQEGNEQF